MGTDRERDRSGSHQRSRGGLDCAWALKDKAEQGTLLDLDSIKSIVFARSVEARSIAAELLSTLPERVEEVSSALNTLMKDKSELVRVAAVEAITRIGDSRFFGTAARLVNDPSPIVRSYAAEALVVLGGTRARRVLQRRRGEERSSLARVGVLGALFKLGEPSALTELLSLLGSRQYRVRCACANMLRDMVPLPEDRLPVLHALRDALNAEDTAAGRDCIRRALHALQNPPGMASPAKAPPLRGKRNPGVVDVGSSRRSR